MIVRRVLPTVKPGYIRELIPDHAPEHGEPWQDIFNDVERVIMPGVKFQNSWLITSDLILCDPSLISLVMFELARLFCRESKVLSMIWFDYFFRSFKLGTWVSWSYNSHFIESMLLFYGHYFRLDSINPDCYRASLYWPLLFIICLQLYQCYYWTSCMLFNDVIITSW